MIGTEAEVERTERKDLEKQTREMQARQDMEKLDVNGTKGEKRGRQDESLNTNWTEQNVSVVVDKQ